MVLPRQTYYDGSIVRADTGANTGMIVFFEKSKPFKTKIIPTNNPNQSKQTKPLSISATKGNKSFLTNANSAPPTKTIIKLIRSKNGLKLLALSQANNDIVTLAEAKAIFLVYLIFGIAFLWKINWSNRFSKIFRGY